MPRARVIPFLEPAPRLVERSLIAQIGRDQELARLRGRVLGSAGYFVRSLTPEELDSQGDSVPKGSVWIFCHTLEFHELMVLAAVVRRIHPLDKLLLLQAIHLAQHATDLFDAALEAPEAIDTLLRVVAQLARRTAD